MQPARNATTVVRVSTDGDENHPQLKSYLSTKYGDRIKEMDKDNDGTVDRKELLEFMAEVVEKETKMKYLKWGIAISLGLLLLFAFSTFGLVWAGVLLSKDTSVSNATLVVKGSEKPVATRNTDFHSERGLFIDDNNNGTVLSTGDVKQEMDLTKLPALFQDFKESEEILDSYVALLNNLDSITIEGDGKPTMITVYNIAKSSILANSSLLITSVSGDEILIDLDGEMSVNGVVVDHSGRKLLFFHKKAKAWFDKTVVQPVNEAIIKPIVEVVTCLFSGEVCGFLKTLSGAVKTEAEAFFNRGLAAVEGPARDYINSFSSCVSSIETLTRDSSTYNTVLSRCQKFVPCLNVIAPIDSTNALGTENYWRNTGATVQSDLQRCVSGSLTTCWKYKSCLGALAG